MNVTELAEQLRSLRDHQYGELTRILTEFTGIPEPAGSVVTWTGPSGGQAAEHIQNSARSLGVIRSTPPADTSQ